MTSPFDALSFQEISQFVSTFGLGSLLSVFFAIYIVRLNLRILRSLEGHSTAERELLTRSSEVTLDFLMDEIARRLDAVDQEMRSDRQGISQTLARLEVKANQSAEAQTLSRIGFDRLMEEVKLLSRVMTVLVEVNRETSNLLLSLNFGAEICASTEAKSCLSENLISGLRSLVLSRPGTGNQTSGTRSSKRIFRVSRSEKRDNVSPEGPVEKEEAGAAEDDLFFADDGDLPVRNANWYDQED